MYYVDNQNITDPRLNLALEEYLLRHGQKTEPLLLLYINEPSVIVGRNQNTVEEIDPDYTEAHGIHVVRRLSGGGAVYHDLGNLNFSIITPDKNHLTDFRWFTRPVIRVLGELGVEAEFRGKSDIFAAGKKISGNAQYSTAGRLLSHGTLLFDSDLEALLKALNPRQVKIESRAIQSVRSRVVNIRELLTKPVSMAEFKEALLAGLLEGRAVPSYILSSSEWAKIHQIAVDRYHQWDWNYGRSPKFNVQKSVRLATGRLDMRIEIQRGRIETIEISGEYAGQRQVAEFAERLTGIPYSRPALLTAMAKIDQASLPRGFSQDDLLDLFY